MTAFALGLFLALPLAAAAQSSVSLVFTPESARFEGATTEYRAIWSKEGERIVAAMESVSGLRFQEPVPVQVTVFEGISNSGIKGKPMMMRASYDRVDKLGTLIHELGHRLIRQLRVRPRDVDEHRLLNLFLYDVWLKLYGRAFADTMVSVESRRTGVYDYLLAWRWALDMTAAERAARFQAIVQENAR